MVRRSVVFLKFSKNHILEIKIIKGNNLIIILGTYNAVRDKGGSELDASMRIPITKFPTPIDVSLNETQGLDGFVRSFDTTFVGGSPFIEFNLSFEIAFASM